MRHFILALLVGCGGSSLGETSQDLGDPCSPPLKTGPECAPIVNSPANAANGGHVVPGAFAAWSRMARRGTSSRGVVALRHRFGPAWVSHRARRTLEPDAGR